MLGGHNQVGASWMRGRYRRHEGVRLRCEGDQATQPRERATPIRTAEPEASLTRDAAPFLRRRCIYDIGHAALALLHQKPLLRHDALEDPGWGGARGARQKSAGCAAGRGTRPPAQPTIRRRTIPDLGPRRRASDDPVAQIDTGRASAGLRGLRVASSRIDVSRPPQIPHHADAGALGRRQITALESAVRPPPARGEESDSGWWQGCPGGSPLASSSLACAIGGSRHQIQGPPIERRRLLSTAQYEKGQRRLVRRSRNDGVKLAWQEGIREAVLSKCGNDGATGGAQAAADLLADFGWSAGTWMNRSSQIKKWFAFCEEDGRPKVGSSEGDVLAYIGFLHLEGRVGPTSIAQYVTAVSRYHELLHATSPTHTPLVSALVKAYANKSDLTGHFRTARIGLSAHIVQRIVAYGLATDDVDEVGFCATVAFAFVFQCRSVSVAHVKDSDITITPLVITVLLTHRKVKSHLRPLRLSLPTNDAWTATDSPNALFNKWKSVRPPNLGYFNLRSSQKLGSADLGVAVDHALALINETAPSGCYYASHSARIGGFNELLVLQFSREWIMNRLDWESPNMFSLYFDSRITVTAASEWFFAHMRSSPQVAHLRASR